MKQIITIAIAIAVFPCLSDEVSVLHVSRCLRADSFSAVWTKDSDLNWVDSSVTGLCL